MRTPTAQQVAAVLLRYAKRFLWAVPVLLVAACHELIAGLLQDMTPQSLAQLSGWLILGLVLVTSVLAFYFYRYRITKRALLKLKPDYVSEQEKDRVWEQVKRDRKEDKTQL